MREVVGLLLASGFSTRFGSQKLLKSLGTRGCIAEIACRNLIGGTDRVVAVVRPDQQELRDLLRAQGAEIVVFNRANLGIGATLAEGVKASSSAKAWLIALADMPWIGSSTIIQLAALLRENKRIVAPVYKGVQGHPVGFDAEYLDQLIGLTGDFGARSILKKNSDALYLMSCEDPGVILDIDEPADLLKMDNLGLPNKNEIL